MENRIAVYHRLYVLCMAGMLPGLLLSIFLYIRLDMYEVFGYFRRKWCAGRKCVRKSKRKVSFLLVFVTAFVLWTGLGLMAHGEEEPTEEQKEEQESEEPQEEEGKTEEEPQQTFTPKQDSAYDRYTPLVEPLYAAGILEQDFSQEQPVELDSYDWYALLTGLDELAAPFQGMDGNSHYAQDMVEQLLAEHFDVEVEQLRKESEGYSEEFGTYIEPEEVEDSAVPGRISGAQEKDGTLVLVVDLYSPQGKVYNTSVLTIQLQQAESEKEENENILSSLEGWKYLSNTVIYHSDQK